MFWLLAYIRKEGGMFQRLYYRAIAWAVPLSWVFAVWALIAFIVGGLQEYGDLGMNLIWWIVYAILMGGGQTLAWWLAPSAVKFYKWDQQSWWNYNNDQVPDTWPDQLADWNQIDNM